tara:strand:- start:3450 stop:5408 length:1959 start_codon:yes stop_codon:yes gene_type:complete
MISKAKYLLFFVSFQICFAQSPQELQRIKLDYEKMRQQEALSTDSQIRKLNDPQAGIDPSQAILIPYLETNKTDTIKSSNYHFGYDFFIKRDTVGFWENLSIPQNYLLGPGDELVVSLWGETSLRQTYTISREGKIYDEKAGILNISGKTLEEARYYLSKQLGRVYSTLNTKSPSTFLDVSLGSLKSINVNFVGEVKFPGVYAIHPFSNVITGLIQAGGVDTSGSLRSIVIKRNNQTYKEIDLYNYLLKGDISSNTQLKDQDIVFIKIRNSTINVDSSVFRPGIYESVNGETIKDIIDYAGGLKSNASGMISIERFDSYDNKDNTANENFYINYSDGKLYPVKNGDKLIAQKIMQRVQKVDLIGQVKSPGSYNFYDGMKLKELLKLGAGFEDSTFWKSVYQKQAEIVRREPSTRYEKVIYINLEEILSNNNDIILENLDKIVIHSNLNFFEKKNINIQGEVNIPGSYPLLYDNESLDSIIRRAGGLTSKALDQGISVFRDYRQIEVDDNESRPDFTFEKEKRKTRIAWRSKSLVLMPGDSIFVGERTNTVSVQGQVFNPGIIEFEKGRGVNYYLNSAGGLTELASTKDIIVVYPNGLLIPSKWYSKPKVVEGSTIYVSSKLIEEPFNITQFATNWTSIISSMVTVVILSRQL